MRLNETISLIMISAASLAYEICLTRIFSVQQFHHFAFIVISLAVMGYAASGVALSLSRIRVRRTWLASSFALSTLLAYLIINYLPFDSFSIVWDRTQLWILLLYFASAGLPFLFAGWFIGQALRAAGQAAFRPYAANLIGASAGCLVALIGLQLTSEEGALGISIAVGFLATALVETDNIRRALFVSIASLLCVAFLWPLNPLRLRLSPYKPLSVSRQFPGARIVATERNASARIDVLESRGIHSFPGLSLTSAAPELEQMGLFIDGEGPYPITKGDLKSSEDFLFAQHLPAALAYLLRPGAEVLIVDPGTGLAVQAALALGVEKVSLPTDQPLIPALLTSKFSVASGNYLSDKRIHIIPRSSRGVLALKDQNYTIIEWALKDPYRPITSGAFSLTEDYLLTREAFMAAWERLSTNGLIIITRWVGTPPSEATRVWSTVIQAMSQLDVNESAPHLVAYRGMRTASILISKQPFTKAELTSIRDFLRENAFDPIYLPDLVEAETNQFNRLPEPVYSRLFKALLEAPQSTIRSYDFRLEPTTDDRPYFFHFFRWSQSSQVLATMGMLWQPFGGSGYFVIVAMLALMLLLSTPLVLFPWLSIRRDPERTLPSYRVWLYFGGLGAGFMLVEIPLILRMNLLLDYPILAFGLVLFTLLLASGMGSFLSRRIPLRKALALLLGFLLLNIFLLPTIVRHGLTLSLDMRMVVTILWLAPTGFLMGIPFAAGMRVIEAQTPGIIPWAWAINGATSGISGVLASLGLMDLGFQITLGIGALCYTIVLFASSNWRGV